MATSIVNQEQEELNAAMELLKDAFPDMYSRYKRFNYIVDTYSVEIAELVFKCKDDEMPAILIENLVAGERAKLRFEITKIDALENQHISICEEPLGSVFDKKTGRVLIYCEWLLKEECLADSLSQPKTYLGWIPTPFRWDALNHSGKTDSSKVKKPLEKNLEDDLLRWLHSRGIRADNQVSTLKHRLDVWLPGFAFLELKRGKVSGDDICQAIDYCSEYKKSVILVGNHISTIALRGAEAFNRAVDSEMIVYVSWSAIKTYLKGLLSIH